MSASLANLPPELFGCVVANIESQRTLCNLAQCSRQCYLSMIPHLYHDITIKEEITQDTKRKGRLENLAAFLIRKPDVAQLVASFTLRIVYEPIDEYQDELDFGELDELDDGSDSEEFDEHKGHRSDKTCKVDQAFETLVNLMSVHKSTEYYWRLDLKHTQKGHLDVLLALLLPTLLNLRKIVLDSDTSFDTPFLDMVIGRVADREKPFDIHPPFEALTVFTHLHDQSIRGPSIMVSLLKLPAIQVISQGLECIMDRDEGENWNLVRLESSSSPLTSLDLADHGLDPKNLGHILRVPKALKTFSYMLPDEAGYLDFADILHALRPQENCLESIGFDYGRGIERSLRMRLKRRFDPIKSFIGFTTLKVFKIAAVFLEETEYGSGSHSLIDIFPTNLETLHVTRFNASCGSLPEALEHLLTQQSPQQIPSLKDLILDQTESDLRRVELKDVLWIGTQETAIGRLSKVAAARNVSLDLI